MDIKKVKTIFFSPGRKTGNIASVFSRHLGYDYERYDITSYKKRDTKIELANDEVAVFAYPVYGGRVVDIMVNQFENIVFNNNIAVVLAVYGNRAYEDALLEMQDLLEAKGVKVIAAGAFIANHSIMRKVAAGRPDEKDMEIVEDFAKKVRNKIDNLESFEKLEKLKLPGNHPYRKYNGIPLKPKGNRKCVACMACVNNCPVNAIPKENPRYTDKSKCITCMGCHVICPQNARHLNVILHELSEISFKMKYGKRKEPDIFI